MSDNKNMQDGRDRNRIDANDPNEVEYVQRQFPEITHQEVMNAIQSYGPMREDVMRVLRGRDKDKGPRSAE